MFFLLQFEEEALQNVRAPSQTKMTPPTAISTSGSPLWGAGGSGNPFSRLNGFARTHQKGSCCSPCFASLPSDGCAVGAGAGANVREHARHFTCAHTHAEGPGTRLAVRETESCAAKQSRWTQPHALGLEGVGQPALLALPGMQTRLCIELHQQLLRGPLEDPLRRDARTFQRPARASAHAGTRYPHLHSHPHTSTPGCGIRLFLGSSPLIAIGIGRGACG